MFLNSYNLFGEELHCLTWQCSSKFKLEADSYTYLKRKANNAGTRYIRVDTVNQIGFPDILLLRQDEYCMIEVKRLKRKKLVSLENNLDWQYGQVAFALRAIKLKESYALAVVVDNTLALISKERTLCLIQSKLLCL